MQMPSGPLIPLLPSLTLVLCATIGRNGKVIVRTFGLEGRLVATELMNQFLPSKTILVFESLLLDE